MNPDDSVFIEELNKREAALHCLYKEHESNPDQILETIEDSFENMMNNPVSSTAEKECLNLHTQDLTDGGADNVVTSKLSENHTDKKYDIKHDKECEHQQSKITVVEGSLNLKPKSLDSFENMINTPASSTAEKECLNLHTQDLTDGGADNVVTPKLSENHTNDTNQSKITVEEGSLNLNYLAAIIADDTTTVKKESANLYPKDVTYAGANGVTIVGKCENHTNEKYCIRNDNVCEHHLVNPATEKESIHIDPKDLADAKSYNVTTSEKCENRNDKEFVNNRVGNKLVELENTDEKTVDTVSISESDDGDIDGENVEIVKMPVAESDEMILPDTAEDVQTLKPSDCEEETEFKLVIKDQGSEMNAYEEPTVDPELMVCQTRGDNDECIQKIEGVDPLHFEGSIIAAKVSTNANAAEGYDEDDDDDVQVIELRSSPICLDSDDNSNPTSALTKSGVINVTSKTLEEQKKRNSTTCFSMKKKSKSRRKAKPSRPLKQRCIIDTINLIDSSDENESGTNQLATKTPMKRRLLPKAAFQANSLKTANHSSFPSTNTTLHRRPAPKIPSQTYISTPQSNFLNAVNLLPANVANPPAFSAQLLNRNVIIPNAFYGNPPEMREQSKAQSGRSVNLSRITTHVLSVSQCRRAGTLKEQINRQWLENFLANFASPVQVASHTCFVLLQRVLKYKLLQKIREARINLNTLAQASQWDITPAGMDVQLMLDLRNVFFNSDSQLSETGLRFCEIASSYVDGKVVPLTTDIKTGRVTSRTRDAEEMTRSTAPLNKQINGSMKAALSQTNGCSKRKQDPDLDEYTPSKAFLIGVCEEGAGQGERKRSLRRNRTKRCDDSFSYNEDQHDESEEGEGESYAAIARKVEQKRQEAKLRSERMAKSFENAYIEAFSKSMREPKRFRISPADRPHKTVNSVLTNHGLLEVGLTCGNSPLRTDSFVNGNEDSNSLDDDGPREHRIYKVTPSIPYHTPNKQSEQLPTVASYLATEIVACSDESDDLEQIEPSVFDPTSAPKNTDQSLHMMAKHQDLCVICRNRFQRIVHHYVNEHRGCEVYTSRLSKAQVTSLRRKCDNLAQVSLYKNGQSQYEATCAFCQKRSRFMLSYWHQHFTMHTGEYAYRCGGCGIRKPTRSLMVAHINTPCRQGGSVMQDFIFDAKSTQIEARICGLCNYVQLHRSNLVHHLRSQHGLREILPKHIKSVVLLRITSPEAVTAKKATAFSALGSDFSLDTNIFEHKETGEINNYIDSTNHASMTQFNYDDSDASDDLSFMICGMLDVQVHTE